MDASLADLEYEHESWLDSVVDVLQLDVDARERDFWGAPLSEESVCDSKTKQRLI